MPLYDLKCKKCSHEWEGFARVKSKNHQRCPKCKKACGETLITCKSDPGLWCIGNAEYDEGLDAMVTGPGHRKQLMKERSLEEL